MTAAATIASQSETLIKGTILLDHALHPQQAIQVHEGSSSSSKTFSIAQALIVRSFQESGKTFSVVRKTMPAMKRGALKDFNDVLTMIGGFDAFTINKTDLFFVNKRTQTRIEFFAVDNPQKARGPRRDVLWCNEANELGIEDYRQLAMRTREQIYIDYNPSMLNHWIYDEVLTDPDCELIHSTYRINPYLTERVRREIERNVPSYELPTGETIEDWDLTYTGGGTLISGDPYWWAVYGLGQRGSPTEAIFPIVGHCPAFTPDVYGLDFGYNHPCVLVGVARVDKEGKPDLLIDELLHESYLTVADLIERLPGLGIKKHYDLIYADGSRPEMIEEMTRAGYNVQPANKKPGSVYAGISYLKEHAIHLTRRSTSTKAQFQDYRWKKRPDGTILDEPVKLNDDGPDAVRYAAYTLWGEPPVTWLIS